VDNLDHVDLQAHVHAGGHRVDKAEISAVRQIAEVVPVVLGLVPHPAQGLAFREVCGLGLDHRAQALSGPPLWDGRQPGIRKECVDRLGDGGIRPELAAQPVDRRGKRLVQHREIRLDLNPGQPTALRAVKAPERC